MQIIDILIIGGGGAGLSAAIEAKRGGAKVTVLSKTSITSSQTCQAQGGINAVLDETKDSIQDHISDTLKSAHNIGNIKTIQLMCEKAKETINWLDNLAVPFSRNQKGNIAQRKLGGTKNSRACYSSDYTGLKILHTLFDTCLKENIDFLEEYLLLHLIVEDNITVGAVVLDIKTTQIKQILAKKVILASGGYAGIYTNYNTNSYATTGDGIAIASRAGARLAHIEYIQFHPTALKESSILISESARGEGGYLVTSNGERFIDELKPRDEVARAIYSKIQNGEEVFLDVRHLGIDKLLSSMPQEYQLVEQYTGLKMDKDLIAITPVAHYSMGGISVDINGQTSIKNLYAVGECANNGVHGANRLGGNSLLEIIVFGRIAGQNAIQDLDNIIIEDKKYQSFLDEKNHLKDIFAYPNKINFYDIKKSLGEELYKNVGLFRNEEDLETTLIKIKQWQLEVKDMGIGDKGEIYNTNLKEFYEFTNMLEVANILTKGAIIRKESRGAHYRTDYPQESMEFAL